MSNISIETEVPVAATQPSEPETKPHKTTKVAQPNKRGKGSKKGRKAAAQARTRTTAAAERGNKKAEVIAMMKRPKGARRDHGADGLAKAHRPRLCEPVGQEWREDRVR